MVVHRFAPAVVAPKHISQRFFCAATGTKYSCASSVTVLWRVFRRKICLRLLRHCVLACPLAQNILVRPPTPCFGASSGAKYSCASSVTVLWRLARPTSRYFVASMGAKYSCASSVAVFWRVYWRKIFLRLLCHGILAHRWAQNILVRHPSWYLARLLAQNILSPPLSRYFGASTGAKYSCVSSVTVFWRVYGRKVFLRLLCHVIKRVDKDILPLLIP
jgi:hypothetical protein